MLKHTKIVATISDKKCEVDFLQQLFDEGMNVVRMNSAHLDDEGFLKIINNARQVSSRIGLLMDTKGPEIRTTFAEQDIILKTGDVIRIEGNPEGISSREAIYVSYPNLTERMEVGKDILIDDGEVDLRVTEVHDKHLICVSQNDGVVGSRKSVNIPDVRIDLPSLTEKDIHNILFAIKNDVDFVAHSFVRNKQDVLEA